MSSTLFTIKTYSEWRLFPLYFFSLPVRRQENAMKQTTMVSFLRNFSSLSNLKKLR